MMVASGDAGQPHPRGASSGWAGGIGLGRKEFGLGVLVGGLTGLAIGYVIRRRSMHDIDELSSPETIDLTPALRRRSALAATVPETAGASE